MTCMISLGDLIKYRGIGGERCGIFIGFIETSDQSIITVLNTDCETEHFFHNHFSESTFSFLNRHNFVLLSTVKCD